MAKAKNKAANTDQPSDDLKVRIDALIEQVNKLSKLYQVGIVPVLDYTVTGIVPSIKFSDLTKNESTDSKDTSKQSENDTAKS